MITEFIVEGLARSFSKLSYRQKRNLRHHVRYGHAFLVGHNADLHPVSDGRAVPHVLASTRVNPEYLTTSSFYWNNNKQVKAATARLIAGNGNYPDLIVVANTDEVIEAIKLGAKEPKPAQS